MLERDDVAWVAKVMPDWTTLQILTTGQAFAFNRETGRVYLVPHPDVPFVQVFERYTAATEGESG